MQPTRLLLALLLPASSDVKDDALFIRAELPEPAPRRAARGAQGQEALRGRLE
jgi:hypothetical protein